MSTLSKSYRRYRTLWLQRKIDRCHELRRRLAYYVAKHGFEVGDYSYGAPTIRFWDETTRLPIGKYCSIAEGATFILGGNHRIDAVTTFPLGRLLGPSGPVERPDSRGDIVIGSDVWIAANAIILSGVTIGDGAIVGAGTVVASDIPPYAVVAGNPAGVIRKRFSEPIIDELPALRWWDLSAKDIMSLRPLLQGNDVKRFIEECRRLKGLPPSDQATIASGRTHLRSA
jgi:acetyltransferase-like isoleucine patch superfamily enzyme